MKQLILSCNVTVDGFMAGPDDDLASLDSIVGDRQLEDYLAGKFKSVADTIVVGRQTFLDMEAYWATVDSVAEARTYYDHLARRLGIGLYGALVDSGALVPTGEVRGEVRVGPAASRVFGALGVDPVAVAAGARRRRFAFACPDWTERIPHLGGALGAAVRERFCEEGWVGRSEDKRAVSLTGAGERALRERLGLRIFRAGGPDPAADGTREGERS